MKRHKTIILLKIFSILKELGFTYSKKLRFFPKGLLIPIFSICIALNSFGQTTYTWNVAGNGSWSTAGNWTPNRTTPAINDILVFNNGGTKTISNVPTQTIGALLILNNTNITLDGPGGPGKILTIGNVSGTDLSITGGSSLTNSGTLDGFILSANSTSDISGTLNVDAGSIFDTDASGVVTTVFGIINNLGTVISTNSSRLLFDAGSTYIHNIEGVSIPLASWNITSNCNITGVTNNAPAGLTQSFGNFSWQCNHAANTSINLNSALTTIQGNFNVLIAGRLGGGRVTAPLILSSNASFTLNVGGNININTSTEATWLALTSGTATVTVNVTGNFNMSGSTSFFDYAIGTTMNSHIVNVAGNLDISGGLFDWTYIPTAGSNYAILNLNGNFSLSGTGAMITSVASTTIPNGKIKFVRTGNQTISVSNPANLIYTNFEVGNGSVVEILNSFNLTSQGAPYGVKGGKFEVLTGGILDMKANQILSSSGAVLGFNNSFILNSGAGFITASANGVHQTASSTGSISALIANRTFSSAANYTYDGTVTQNSGTFVTTPVANQVNNLTISNTSGNTTGVTLQQPIAVAGTCTFNTGLLTTSSTNLLIINDNATTSGAKNSPVYSFANGPVKKIGNDVFSFPIGKLLGGYRFLSISAPANISDEFTCEFLRANARLLGPVSLPLTRVSQCEYWKLDKNSSASATINVTISWNALSPCNATYVTNRFLLAVARFEGPNWINAGFNSINGNNTVGDITSDPATVFGYFSLASRDYLENVLPTALFDLQLQKQKEGIAVNWKNTKEEKVAYYQVMRSTNGKDFIQVGTVNSIQNGGTEARYQFIDRTATDAVYYYRIKLVNIEFENFYSNTARINLGSKFGNLNILSNPVADHRLAIQLNDLPAGIYNLTLLNSSGQVVYKNNLKHSAGSATYSFQLSATLTKGVYYLQLNSAENRFTKTIILQ